MLRREFLATGGAAWASAAGSGDGPRAVDFRYAPRQGQATICFPDDPFKSLVGEKGDLRYGFDRRKNVHYFPCVVEFGLRGTDPDEAGPQRLESPRVPIVHTRIDRPGAFVELTAFATNAGGEGRADNVLVEVRPREQHARHANPVIRVRTRRVLTLRGSAVFDGDNLLFLSDSPLRMSDAGDGYLFTTPERTASASEPLRCFFRFPQEGQAEARLEAGLRDPDALLAGARQWWREFRAVSPTVGWQLPGIYQNFLEACARNILQARERVNGRLTFQVGPTTYRGLWVVDGNFLLEAARYLGYDREAAQGLETTWGMQREDGSVVAAVETAHWKDTAIAMFSLARQAELGGDWSYFRSMQENVLRGVRFLRGLRDKARGDGSANGRYGLLARGFGDGGIGGGVRDEFTNTLWTLAGLRAVTEVARRQGIAGFEEAAAFHGELREAFFAAAKGQMRRHEAGFEYLPMLLSEDPGWKLGDEWARPRPQSGQWALAHAIYPGLVFEPGDPVVEGYLALMRQATREDVPAETGWLPHEGLWTYDAAFAAHVELWAGAREAALGTFTGFLNHATPLYCWREEQPLRGALAGSYVGDMPHNWASAECVLFLRHMLALEDGRTLRLLAGVETGVGEAWALEHSPTRFGRIGMRLEPAGRGWRCEFRREDGPAPERVELPESLGGARFESMRGVEARREGGRVRVDPGAGRWEARWR